MISQELTIPVSGAPMGAYLTRPVPESGSHPAVIVLPEIYGLNAEMRRVTELLPTGGYVGLAIDFFHRTHPNLNSAYNDEGRNAGRDAASQVTREQLMADIAAAVDWLNAQDFVRTGKVATWGFCFGGTAAFMSATMDGIAGAASFYGTGITSEWGKGEAEALRDADRIKAPLLIVVGEEDDSIPKDQIKRLCNRLEERGPGCQIQIYKAVGHAFFRENSSATHGGRFSDEAISEASADAWNLVQTFFRKCFAKAPSSPAKV
jgi:carboxymethylenebutenolidase